MYKRLIRLVEDKKVFSTRSDYKLTFFDTNLTSSKTFRTVIVTGVFYEFILGLYVL